MIFPPPKQHFEVESYLQTISHFLLHRARPCLALSAFLLLSAAGAQDHWARRMGYWSNDAYNDVAIAADGSLFTVGEFGGSFQMGGMTVVSAGSLDAMVAKYTAEGTLVWVRTFGGEGLDKGIKLELTGDGGIAVVGQYMGSADFDGTTLTSQGGTQDCFVVKLSQSTGSVLWARSGGGADGVDQPNGVSVGPDGTIAVAGEFRGTAVFDQGTITSITDPDTNAPSVDIFLAIYSAAGDPLWLKHGAAEYSDRGIDVEHDNDGNVYLTGQFTDTLTIDVVHNNAMYSAVFIARFSPAGAEEWFRAFGGGTYNQVFEMILVEDSMLMLVGDVQGTVIFLDTEPDLFTATQPRSSYLMKVGLDGEFIAQTTWGSEHPMSTRALSVEGEDVAVLGRYMCQLTGFVPDYGEASFMATGLNDLYVARFHLPSLELRQAQQFGGQGDKVPGGIVHRPDGDVVFAGAFEHLLVFPTIWPFDADPGVWPQGPSTPIPYCDDENYSSYTGLNGYSLKDGFLARGFVDDREPYDIYDRTGTDCVRDIVEPYIGMQGLGMVGPDSIAVCGEAYLYAETRTGYTPDTSYRHTAPDFHFLWSTGSQLVNIHGTQSGWYWVDVTMGIDCYSWRDSLYLTVNPLPSVPLVNDDVVVNTNSPNGALVRVCLPQLPWLWATGVDPLNTVVWYPPASDPVANDSVQVSVGGPYTVEVTTPAGCTAYNYVPVILDPSGPLDDFEVELSFSFPGDPDGNDTLSACVGTYVLMYGSASITLGGAPASVPNWVSMGGGCPGPSPGGGLFFGCDQYILLEGWYVFPAAFMLSNAPCGDDTLVFHGIDSIYVEPLPVIQPNVTIEGPDFICPGDTVMVIGSCSLCTSTTWSGSGIVASAGDTIWVNTAGYFYLYGNTIAPGGCQETDYASLTIPWNPVPLLHVDPIDGIICPNDSAVIWTSDPGSQFQWYGPLGPLSVDNDSIFTSQEGFYYLEMVDALGCSVTSDPLLVTDYATPYLNVLPDGVLCEPGETAVLQVVTTSTSSLVWEAPFAGSTALSQTVTQPGVYTCHVSACGIVTTLSMEIFGNNANAELSVTGPFDLCPGDEVTLEAQPGGAIYYWYPGPVFGTELTVDATGTYLLVVTDALGCQDSLTTVVTMQPEYVEFAADEVDFCEGEEVTLVVEGDDLITWYGDEAMTIVLGTGNALDLGLLWQDTTVWAEQVVGPCSSGLVQVDVNVHPMPMEPVLLGDTTVCAGGVLSLETDEQSGVSFIWQSPAGTSYTGTSILIDPVDDALSGPWNLLASNAGCPAISIPFMVEVIEAAAMSIGPDTTICPGGTAQFNMPPGFSQPLWIDGSASPAYATGDDGPVWLSASDGNGCIAQDTVLVILFSNALPLSTTGITICLGESAMLIASGSGMLNWYSDPALTQLVHTGSTWSFDQPIDSAVYYVTQTEGPCTSGSQPVLLAVVPIPLDVELIAPPEICAGEELVIELIGPNDPIGQWTTPAGELQTSTIVISSAGLSDAGLYIVVPYIGACAGDTLEATIIVRLPDLLDLGPDTVFCIGGSIALSLPAGFTQPQWSTGATSSSITITEPGIYSLQAVDAQGCVVQEVIIVDAIDCPDIIPNIFTPNGDSQNDVWQIGRGPWVSAQMEIYNRWGQLVWNGDAISTGFDGRHSGSGEPLPEGTYFYVANIVRGSGAQDSLRGHLTLLR